MKYFDEEFKTRQNRGIEIMNHLNESCVEDLIMTYNNDEYTFGNNNTRKSQTKKTVD